MAYIQEQLTDEERKQQQEAGGGAPLADQPGAPVSGGTIGEAPVEKGPKVGGGGTKSFTDVRSFLEANRPQAQELAQNVGSRIQSEAESARQSIADTGTQYRDQIEQGTLRTEPVRGLISQAAQTPQEILKDQQKTQQLTNVRTGEFTGPRAVSAEDTSRLRAAAQEAQRKAGLTESQTGREELLGITAGKNTRGGMQLDQLLLSQTPEARQALLEAGKASQGLEGELESTVGDVGQFAQAAQDETAATKALFGDTFAQAKTDFQAQLDQRLAQTRAEAEARAVSARGAIAEGSGYDEQALRDLGVAEQDLKGILQAQKDLKQDYGIDIDLTQYLQQSGPQYSRSQVATQEDLARQKALEELAGSQFGVIGDQVGGANLDVTDFAGDLASSSTRGGLESRDKQIIDRYFDRQDISDEEWPALQNALKRQREYASGKKFREEEGGPGLGDTLFTDPTTGMDMRNVADKVGEVQKGVENTGEFFSKPARQVRDEVNGVIDQAKNSLGSNVTDAAKEAIKTLDPREQLEAVKEIAKDPVKAVQNVAKKVEKTVSKIFCFAAETFFVMADNSTKAIEDIRLGDNMKDGGIVTSLRQSIMNENVFNYLGITVTGDHAVYEDGQWIRVKESQDAEPISFAGVVFSLCNEKHRMISNTGTIFADEQETDNYEELTIDESLQELNSKNGKLAEVN